VETRAEYYKLYYAHIFAGIVEVQRYSGGAKIRHFGCSSWFDLSQSQVDDLLRGAQRFDPPKT